MGGDKIRSDKARFMLRAIYVRESHVWMQEDFNPLYNDQKMQGSFRIAKQKITSGQEAIEGEEEQAFCTITSYFEFGYLLESGEEQETDSRVDSNLDDSSEFVISISAQISADYLTENTTKEEIENWAKKGTLMHTWPYWREYCQSVQMRMNLPILMMPPLYMPSSKEAD